MGKERNKTKTVISKWGNSCGIRLPKGIMGAVNLKEGDAVDILVKGEEIIMRKIRKPASLQERLEKFYGKPINEVPVVGSEEPEAEGPTGKEVW